MASRVNVKFLVILSVGLLLTAGLVGGLGAMVLLKSPEDNIRRGDQLTAEGKYRDAMREYGKAVSKEQQNVRYLEILLEAAQRYIPETDAEYFAQYRDLYIGVIRQLAVAQPHDLEAQQRFLDALLEQYQRSGAGSEAWQGFMDHARSRIADFSGPEEERAMLRRYIGLAGVYRMRSVEVDSEAERREMLTALEEAVERNPDDVEAWLAIVEWHSMEATALSRRGSARGAQAWDRASTLAADVVQRFPGNPSALLRRHVLEVDRVLQSSTSRAAQREAVESLAQRLPQVLDATEAAPKETVTPIFLARLARAVEASGSRSVNERWVEVLDGLLASSPDDIAMVVEKARALDRLERERESIELLEAVATVPDAPVSLEGLLRRQLRSNARQMQATSAIKLWARTPNDSPDRDALMAEAKRYRDQLAERVSEGDPALLRVNARLAYAEGRLNDAQRALSQLRTLTGGQDIEVLSMLGQTLAAQGLTGAAADQFERVVELDPSNVLARLQAAQMLMRADELQAARDMYLQVLEVDPQNEAAKQGLEMLNLTAGASQSSNDPVVQALVRSRELRTGVRADFQASAKLLDETIAAHPDDPRPVLERIMLEATLGRRESALAMIDAALERFPQIEALEQARIRLASDDPVAAQLELIDRSDRSEFEKLLSKAAMYMSLGRADEADPFLQQAASIEPRNPALIELRFVRAIEASDWTTAAEMASRGAEVNADGENGQLFQARLELARGRTEEAAATLQRLTQVSEFNVTAWRLLGSALFETGRVDESLLAFRRALDIKPNDVPTVKLLSNTLERAGRRGEALQLLRASTEFGNADQEILNARLRLEEEMGDRMYAIERRMERRATAPNDRANSVALARLLVLDGRHQTARALIESLKQSGEPDLALALVEAQFVAVTGSPERAEGVVEETISRLPEDQRGAARVALAELLFELGQSQKAIATLEKAREEQGVRMEADRRLGDFYFGVGANQQAIEAYRRIIDARGDTDGRVTKRLAEALLRAGEFSQALDLLDRVERDHGRDVQTVMLRASAASGQNDDRTARSLLDEAVRLAPNSPQPFIRRAQMNFSDPGQFASVQRDLRQAARLQPGNVQVRRMLAQLYAARGRASDAISELGQAVSERPTDDALRLEYIRVLQQFGTPQQVRGALQDAVQARGEAAPVWYQHAGDAFLQAGNIDGAIQLFAAGFRAEPSIASVGRLVDAMLRASPPKVREAQQELAAYQPENPVAEFLVALLRARTAAAAGQTQQAGTLLASSWSEMGSDPRRARVWFEQARLAFGGEAPQLLQFVEALLARSQQELSPAAQVELAKLRMIRRENFSQVLEALAGIEQRTEDAATLLDAMRMRGQIHYTLGQYDKAAEAYRAGVAIAPNDPELNNNAAYVLAKHGNRPQEALPYAERAAEGSPLDPNVLDTLGWIYFQLGRTSQADLTLTSAYETARDDATRLPIALHLAQVREKAGEMEDARRFARQAARLAEDHPAAAQPYESDLRAIRPLLDR